MLGLAPDLPDAPIGLPPVGDRGLNLSLEQQPYPLVERVSRARVEVDRVEQRAPDVVLMLLAGAVADPHGSRPLIAAEVVQHLLCELPLAVDPVQHLEVMLTAGDVGDEVEVVVRLPVEAERVKRPQHERRVPDPAVAVIPVALAVGALGQRSRRGRDQRPRGRVREALQRQGAPLQEAPPRVIREAAPIEPVLPVVGGPDEPAVGLREVLRRRVRAPGQRAVDLLALLHPVPRRRPSALEPEPQVGPELQFDGAALGTGNALVVARAQVFPVRGLAAVVEGRIADERHLDLAIDAAHRPQQHVIGVVVGRRPPVCVRALVLVMPAAYQQHVADDDPAATRPPARLEDHRARQVASRGGDVDPKRAEAKGAGVTVEHGAEHARRVDPWQAHPLDVAARSDERHGLAIGEKRVVGDRRERASAQRHVGDERADRCTRCRDRSGRGVTVSSLHRQEYVLFSREFVVMGGDLPVYTTPARIRLPIRTRTTAVSRLPHRSSQSPLTW